MFTNKTPWLILLILWMGGSTWWHVCRIKQLCSEDTPTTAASVGRAAVTIPGLSLIDGEQLNLNLPGNFSFAKSGVMPALGAVGNSLETLAAYLKANPTRQTTISGYYRAEEANSSAFANLGLARAEAIKDSLVSMGVPVAQLTTTGVLAGDGSEAIGYNATADSLYGGLTFAFNALPTASPDSTLAAKASPTSTKALAESQTFTSVLKPIDLYFESGMAGYIQTQATQQFFSEAATYLSANKTKKLVLTGHTDDDGTEKINLELSEARARGVKNRLIKAGISSEQIRVSGKGENEPKQPNDTPEGRRANRRVTAIVE